MKDAYFDSILGAIVSDFFSVPSVAFAIAAFQLNFVWMIFASIVFMGIEYVFVKLNIYEHYWWKTIYTGFGLMIHFWIGKQFWKSLLQKPIKIYIRIIALYSSYHTIHGLLFYFLVAKFNLFYFHIGLVSNPSRDHIIIQVIYIMIISFISSLVVGLSLKWYTRILGIICIYGFDWLLLKVNILHLSPSFSINKFLIAHLSVLVIIVIFNSILVEKLE